MKNKFTTMKSGIKGLISSVVFVLSVQGLNAKNCMSVVSATFSVDGKSVTAIVARIYQM
jgi:hypothetical protein